MYTEYKKTNLSSTPPISLVSIISRCSWSLSGLPSKMVLSLAWLCRGIQNSKCKFPVAALVLKKPLLVPWLLPQMSSWNFILSHHGGVVSQAMPTKASIGSQFQEMAKNLPLCIVDPQGEAEVCHESHLRLVRTVYRRQTISWKERVLHTSGGFQDPRRVYSSPAGSLHPGTDEQCPERLSKGLGAIRCKNEFDKMVCPVRGHRAG